MKLNIIIQGDALKELKKLPENSMDLIATDPPYQLDSIKERFGKKGSAIAKFGKDGSFQRVSKGFMGKEWDVLPTIKVWKECLRVLKPGAFAFVMCSPRQDSLAQMILRLSEAGFNTGFTSIYWTYASGFPKAGNIGKMVDKRLGRKRKIIGKKYTGKDFADEELVKQGSMMQSQRTEARKDILETKGISKYEGSYAGFQPKPAVEVIIVAMKPLSEKTYVDQALKNKKGITWLDDCRVPYESEKDKEGCSVGYDQDDMKNKLHAAINTKGGFGHKKVVQGGKAEGGRFPANLLVSDDMLNDGKVRKASATKRNRTHRSDSFGMPNETSTEYQDSGSFSRYFDLDKWFFKTFPFLIVPKASKSEKNKGLEGMEKKVGRIAYNRRCKICGRQQVSGSPCKCENPDWEIIKKERIAQNNHPTVKPIKLMTYLITLGSRKDDIVLDPFVGSGTTCIAAKMLKRKYIGIELDKEYCKIAEARLKAQQEPLL